MAKKAKKPPEPQPAPATEATLLLVLAKISGIYDLLQAGIPAVIGKLDEISAGSGGGGGEPDPRIDTLIEEVDQVEERLRRILRTARAHLECDTETRALIEDLTQRITGKL